MGFLFGRKKNKQQQQPQQQRSSSNTDDDDDDVASISLSSVSSCYTSPNTATGVHSSKVLPHNNNHHNHVAMKSSSSPSSMSKSKNENEDNKSSLPLLKSKSKSTKKSNGGKSKSNRGKSNGKTKLKSNGGKSKSSSSKKSVKSSTTTTKQTPPQEVQTQYYQQESHPTMEVKIIGTNRHVTKTTIDGLGRYVKKTKVTKLTDDELDELGIVTNTNTNTNIKTLTSKMKLETKPLSSTSLSSSKYLSDSSHDIHSSRHSSQYGQVQQQQQKVLLTRDMSNSSVESFVDEMTMDPHSDYFNFMDPDAPPVPERSKQPKATMVDDNNNNNNNSSLSFKENFMNNNNDDDDDDDDVATGTGSGTGTGTGTGGTTARTKNTTDATTNPFSDDGINNAAVKGEAEETAKSIATATARTSKNININSNNNVFIVDIDDDTTTNTTTNINESTRDLIKTFIGKIWNHGEIESIPTVCSPSLRFNGRDGLERVGHKGFADMVVTVRKSVASYHCAIHSMVVEDRKCFCRLKFTGRHVGELLGYKPTNKIISWMGASEFTICPKRHQILKVWELGDIRTLEKQLQEM